MAEMTNKDQVSKGKTAGASLASAAAGAAVGLAAGVLFAPKSGKETRAQIKSKARVAKRKIYHRTETMKAKAKELAHRGQEATSKKH